MNDDRGISPFPGNINQIIVKLKPYVKHLEATGGLIGEFVNPKYKDKERTLFKKPTRLECMMQDYPKALPKEESVGFTTFLEVRLVTLPLSCICVHGVQCMLAVRELALLVRVSLCKYMTTTAVHQLAGTWPARDIHARCLLISPRVCSSRRSTRLRRTLPRNLGRRRRLAPPHIAPQQPKQTCTRCMCSACEGWAVRWGRVLKATSTA